MSTPELLPYKFERQSISFYQWLGTTVKSDYFSTTDPVLISDTTMK